MCLYFTHTLYPTSAMEEAVGWFSKRQRNPVRRVVRDLYLGPNDILVASCDYLNDKTVSRLNAHVLDLVQQRGRRAFVIQSDVQLSVIHRSLPPAERHVSDEQSTEQAKDPLNDPVALSDDPAADVIEPSTPAGNAIPGDGHSAIVVDGGEANPLLSKPRKKSADR